MNQYETFRDLLLQFENSKYYIENFVHFSKFLLSETDNLYVPTETDVESIISGFTELDQKMIKLSLFQHYGIFGEFYEQNILNFLKRFDFIINNFKDFCNIRMIIGLGNYTCKFVVKWKDVAFDFYKYGNTSGIFNEDLVKLLRTKTPIEKFSVDYTMKFFRDSLNQPISDAVAGINSCINGNCSNLIGTLKCTYNLVKNYNSGIVALRNKWFNFDIIIYEYIEVYGNIIELIQDIELVIDFKDLNPHLTYTCNEIKEIQTKIAIIKYFKDMKHNIELLINNPDEDVSFYEKNFKNIIRQGNCVISKSSEDLIVRYRTYVSDSNYFELLVKNDLNPFSSTDFVEYLDLVIDTFEGNSCDLK